MLFFRDRISINLVFIPVIAAVQYVFTLGMALAVASVNVFFRDLGNVLRHMLRLWFYLSPALYSLSRLEDPLLQGQPGPARPRQGQSVRDPVRVVPGRHLRHARGWPGAAELGCAGGAARGQHRPGRPDDDPLQAARAVIREGPLMAANAPTLVPGDAGTRSRSPTWASATACGSAASRRSASRSRRSSRANRSRSSGRCATCRSP